MSFLVGAMGVSAIFVALLTFATMAGFGMRRWFQAPAISIIRNQEESGITQALAAHGNTLELPSQESRQVTPGANRETPQRDARDAS